MILFSLFLFEVKTNENMHINKHMHEEIYQPIHVKWKAIIR